MNIGVVLAVVTALFAGVDQASGQDAQRAASQAPAGGHSRQTMTRVEIGAGGSEFLSPGTGFLPGAGVTINLTHALAVSMDASFDVDPNVHGLDGWYSISGRSYVGPDSARWRPFIAYGCAGVFRRRHITELRETLPTGDVLIFPAHASGEITAPAAGTLGAGLRTSLGHRVRLDVGGEFLVLLGSGVATSIHAGISVPIGRLR